MMNVGCLELIEVANRLCQSRLIAIAEQFVVRELMAADEAGQDVTEEVLALLEPAQVYLHARQSINAVCLFDLLLTLLRSFF